MTTSCFHCDEPIPDGIDETLQWKGKTREFCCVGCRSVASAIIENNLDDYYNFRTDSGAKPKELIPQQLIELSLMDDSFIQQDFVSSSQHQKTAELGIEGITCAACSWLIETRLAKEPGIDSIQVNPVTHRLKVKWQDSQLSLSKILKLLISLGYRAYPFQQNQFEKNVRQESRQYLMRLGVAGLGMMQIMMFALGLYIGDGNDLTAQQESFLHWVSGIVALPIVLYSGFPFFRNAWYGLKARHLVMDVPVVIAISCAFVASIIATIREIGTVYFDSVSMFIFFLLLGRFLEHRVRVRSLIATQTQRQMLPLAVIRHDEHEDKTIPLYQVKTGDTLIIKAGDTIPVDGTVTQGKTSINESMLTGESQAVSKQVGDRVLAGSTNIQQAVQIEVTAIGESTYLSALQRMTLEAAQARPAIAHLTDRVAHYFVFAILLIVSIVYLIWFNIDPEKAFWIALSVLVVSCPCALSLATPTALTAASHHLSQTGFLILKPDALPALEGITLAAFDKTGTLTEGQLSLRDVQVFDQSYPTELIKNIAGSLERFQTHPIAQALTQNEYQVLPLDPIEHVIGQGVIGHFNGHEFRVGTAEFCQNGESTLTESNTGKPTLIPGECDMDVYLSCDHKIIACFWLSDSLKPGAKRLFDELHRRHIKTMILSGDKQPRVDNIARTLNADSAFGHQLPEQKAALIAQLQQQGERVLMLGDGINDTVVLAQADIGIAVDTAADITQLNADAVLTANQLLHLTEVLSLAKKTQRIIRQNLTWALAYNLIAIPFAAMGWIPPWLAAIGMTTSSIVVVLNALRLRHRKTSGGFAQTDTQREAKPNTEQG